MKTDIEATRKRLATYQIRWANQTMKLKKLSALMEEYHRGFPRPGEAATLAAIQSVLAEGDPYGFD
jgi:hypothetical protein